MLLNKTREDEERYSSGDLIGKYGLEKYFEKDLRGIDGGKEIEVDALGRKIRMVNWIPPYPGDKLKVSIDTSAKGAAYRRRRGYTRARPSCSPEGPTGTGRRRATAA